MNKKLWTLNLLLLAGLALLGRQWHQNWTAARARERTVLGRPLKTTPPPEAAPSSPAAPLQAAGYLEVAQNLLFSKDRNPNVVIEAAPPKPVPPFPRFFGVMNLGDGLMAILSDGPARQRPFRAGDKVGEFQLAEIGKDALVLEWNQKQFSKKFSELMEREKGSPDPAPAAPVTPPPPPQPAETRPAGPGIDMGAGVAACNPNDASPAGAVVDGKRKVVTDSPFGRICRWETVR